MRWSMSPRKTSTFFSTHSSSRMMEMMEEMAHAIYLGRSFHIIEATLTAPASSQRESIRVDEKISAVKELTLKRIRLQADFAMRDLHVCARFSLPFPSFRHGRGSSRVERGSFSVMDPTFI